MKKFIALMVLLGLLFCFNLHYAKCEGHRVGQTTQSLDKQQLNRHSKKEADKASKELQLKEQKKKKIEAEEHSVNKNKPVKRFSSDKDIPETVKKRNIP